MFTSPHNIMRKRRRGSQLTPTKTPRGVYAYASPQATAGRGREAMRAELDGKVAEVAHSVAQLHAKLQARTTGYYHDLGLTFLKLPSQTRMGHSAC